MKVCRVKVQLLVLAFHFDIGESTGDKFVIVAVVTKTTTLVVRG